MRRATFSAAAVLCVVTLGTACTTFNGRRVDLPTVSQPRAVGSVRSPQRSSPSPVATGLSHRPPSAIHATHRCSVKSLHAAYRAGGFGTGTDFGSIYLWTTAHTNCRLAGRVQFTAETRTGHLDPNAMVLPWHHHRSVDAVLRADNHRPGPRTDPDQGYLVFGLLGFFRDDGSQPDGLCRQADEVRPARLRLAVGSLRWNLRNQELNAPQNRHGVYGCHGNIGLSKS